MSDPISDMPQPPLKRLEAVVGQMPGPVFAVVDGGLFDNIALHLAKAGLSARSLFLGSTTRDVQRYGPWFVPLVHAPDLSRILALIGERPAAVFWSCPDGAQSLYGHLRRLNLVRVPQPAKVEEIDGSGGIGPIETSVVLFRHWDPRALSVVLPSLDEAQYARVLGPSDEAAYVDPKASGGAGLRRLKRFPELPIAPCGMLSLSTAQMAAMDGSMQERSRRKTATYLTDVAPDLAGQLSPAELYGRVQHAQQTGRALGVTSERAHMKWAYLMLITEGRVAAMPHVTTAIGSGDQKPDQQVDFVMRQVVRAARRREGL